MRVLVTALLGFALYGAVADKFRVLQSGRAPAGTRIVLTAPEIRQWIRDESPYWSSLGVTNLRVNLGSNRATGYADVDFIKARKATTGEEAGWIFRSLFSGRKPIAVTARFSSGRGRGRVDIERLDVNGIPVSGPALDFLLEEFVRPSFPAASVGESFRLDYRVDRFAVAPGGVTISIGK